MRYIFSISLIIVFAYACKQQTIRMDEYEVHGIDVSHYQSRIQWDSIVNNGIHFAFVKATEGLSMKDSLFTHNWAEMNRVGIKRGAYHFYYPSLSAEEQAKNFLSSVELLPGDLPPVLDVEVLAGSSKVRLITGIRTWLYLTEIEYGVKPILYTNLKFYNKYLAGQFDDYPVWIARYNTREPSLACGREWQFWQYGNRGRIAGIAGDVDFNVFQGSWYELEELCLSPPTVLSYQ
ncbi:MAG: glycoside hydrolase family 25 protein [Chitinophagales bacterium]|nr:glycoside hydrolase family 25 protein [Chitinophagales bacterium]